MKRLFYNLLAVVMLSAMPAYAQWQSSDDQAVRLDGNNTAQSLLRSIRTAEGNIILSWVRCETAGLSDDNGGYRLYVQVFNADGSMRFGQNGLCISNKRTNTYTTDYSLALAPNGDILLAYWDARDDASLEHINAYLYRYTQAGQAVWSADGIRVPVQYAVTNPAYAEDASPQWCISGDNIYLALYHIEAVNQDAAPTENCQLFRINDDGSCAWNAPMVVNYPMVLLQPCADGDAYMVYSADGMHLHGQRLRADGSFAWAQAVAIGDDVISNGFYVPTPQAVTDSLGDLLLTYRVLSDWSGYQVLNRLTKEGQVYTQSVSLNHSTDGDAGGAACGVKGQSICVAWDYAATNNQKQLMTNLLGSDGTYLWAGNRQYGQVLAANNMWGFVPMAVIPQANGWVLIYGDCTGWNSANMMVAKLTDTGEQLWSKQIATSDVVTFSFSVAYDADHAYIFYAQEAEYDDEGEEIAGSGGMYVLYTDITDEGNKQSGLEAVSLPSSSVSKVLYNGKMVITRSGKIYTTTGIQLR